MYSFRGWLAFAIALKSADDIFRLRALILPIFEKYSGSDFERAFFFGFEGRFLTIVFGSRERGFFTSSFFM